MSYETKRRAFNGTLFFAIVAGGVLAILIGVTLGSRVEGESLWKRARRLEAELSQAVAESEALGTTLGDATNRLAEVEGALRDATIRVGELEADNIRALELVGNITELSVGLAEGSGDIDRLSRELAAEIDIALATVRRLQEGIAPSDD